MEPLAASSSAHGIRPVTAALQAELSMVLREGRVLAGSVLARNGDGTLLLSLGRHQVPAETALRLDPGEHFLVRVQEGPEGVVLKLLGGSTGGGAPLLQALRSVIAEDRPIGQLLQELAGRLRTQASQPGVDSGPLRTLLATLQGEVLDVDADAEAVRRALLGSGLRYEAALLSAARGEASPATFAGLASGLKGQLLELLERLEDGPVREALQRALAGLEAEQLLNAARRESGEPLVWSFPFADAGGWTTARLALEEREPDADAGEQQGVQRLVLGVSFSALGPVRADLVRAEERTTLRLLVEREEIAARIQADLEQLQALLGDGRREVVIQARVGTTEELALEDRARNVGYLRDHHVMDVAG